jgi:hypothetical protein
MKKQYVQTFESFKHEHILESKQIGVLYHYTTLHNLFRILNSNILKYSSNHDSISFTRDKNAYKSIARRYACRIVIDGDKLSNNYKIKPYQDYYDSNIKIKIPDEQEERIINKNINDIKKYILYVDLFEYNVDEELSLYNNYELSNFFGLQELNINDLKEIIEDNYKIKTRKYE